MHPMSREGLGAGCVCGGLTCAGFRKAVPHGKRGSPGGTPSSAATAKAPPAVIIAIVGAAAAIAPVAAGVAGAAAAVTWGRGRRALSSKGRPGGRVGAGLRVRQGGGLRPLSGPGHRAGWRPRRAAGRVGRCPSEKSRSGLTVIAKSIIAVSAAAITATAAATKPT